MPFLFVAPLQGLRIFALIALISFNLLYTSVSQAQTVGLVLSGGGASGLAHIGVLKILEKNQIPIDYIAGTSMGAIIAALYASGYTPEQIEELVLSDAFKDWAYGKTEYDYIYYYQQ